MSEFNTLINESTEDEVIITRIIDAPRELVFKAWSDREHLMQWFAPNGCSASSCSIDFRVGGRFHFCMKIDKGMEIWGLGIYREIEFPAKIVYLDSFADAQGNVVPPSHYGASPEYPSESLVTVMFFEQEGKTKLTIRHAISQGFKEREGIYQGWSEMLIRLDEHLTMKVGKTK